MAGVGQGISDDLISLEIASPDVPDLTLIDLPGIARVAVKGQPENIGEQVCLSSTQYFGPGENILTTIGRIALKSGTNSHGRQRMKPNFSGDSSSANRSHFHSE